MSANGGMTVDNTDIIRQYIMSDLVKDKKKANLGDSDLLIESGIVDSLGIMKLIGFLEDKIGITITDDEMIPENFSTIKAIARFVGKKKIS